MTKIAVLADIHGNLPALQAVAQDLQKSDVDHVIVAGDVINWGPFGRQVLEFITNEGWAVIRGNHEFYLLDANTERAPGDWDDTTQYSLLPWLGRQLAGKWQQRIDAWPDTISLRFPDAPPVRVVHGTPDSPWEPIFPNTAANEIEAMLSGVQETTVIAAHTHIAMDQTVRQWHIVNPGSVGVPLDGVFAASYMLMEGTVRGWQADLRRVPFDYEPIFTELERQRFVEVCGVVGHLVLAEFKTALPHVHSFLNWRKQKHTGRPLTLELLSEFAKVNPVDYADPAYRQQWAVSGSER